jgi:PAS domain S-box-containing protein
MSTELTLLVVGAADSTRRQIQKILHESAWSTNIRHLSDFDRLPEVVEGPDQTSTSFDLVLCETNGDPERVDRVLRTMETAGAEVPVLVLSESDSAEDAVDAMKAGAKDWIITHHLQQRLLPAIEHALQDVQQLRSSAQVAAALEDSRQRYHDLAEALPQVVYELDRQGRFTFCNRRGLELFGYTQEDLDRHPHVGTVVAEEDRARAMERVRNVLAGESSDRGAEYTILSSDGTRIPSLVYSGPIIQDGEVVGLRGVLTDLREIRETEKQLRQSEERYRRLVETMGDGLVTIDRNGIITFANQALARMIKQPLDQVQGRDVRTLLDEENAAILDRQIERRFNDGAPGVYELQVQAGPDEQVSLLITSTPLRDEHGRITASLAVITDITEQRRAQEHLLRIKTALDNSSDAIGIANSDRTPIYLNPAFEKMFGCNAEQLREAGGARANFASEEDYERVFQQVAAEGTFVGEFEGQHISGRTFPVMGRVDTVRDSRGELTGIVAVFTDITRRRHREERQRLVNARLSLVNQLNQMLNAGDSIDEIIAAGADGLRDVLDAHHVHIFLRRSRDDRDELALRYSNMPQSRESQVFGRSGGDVEIVMPLHEEIQAWAIYQSGELMEVGEPDLRRTTRDIERWVTPEPNCSSPEIAKQLGMKYLCLAPLMRGERAIGHVTVSRSRDRPLTGVEKGLLEGFAQQMAVVLDKARTERELSRLNNFLQGIIENAAVWFSVIDERGDLVIWNRAAREISGYRHDQIESASDLMRLLYPDEQARREAMQYVTEAFAGTDLGEIETEIIRADGSRCRIAWHLRSFTADDGGTGLVTIGRDVTESRRLQEQLQRVQRMDAVGTLAGGIAHDFNNVLTAIIGHADLLASDAEENSRSRWHASQISRNAERASRLTRQLLAFSRRQPSRPQVVDLNHLIVEMEEMFRRIIPEDIDLQLDLCADLGCTRIDPSQTEQIVMNLVLNARDAMPGGGELRITTANAELGDSSVGELFDAEPGEYVSVEVEDTGVGMDEQTEARIFEPFFTTRHDSGGTGLGLSTVYGLVRQNEGAITVYSEAGEGTVFRIYLPRVDETAAAEAPLPEGAHTDLEGDETLLVVEDAENLRDLIGTILESFGYTVHTAARGDLALEVEQAHRGEIDMVVTDVVMPEMSGTELADRLLEVSPELQVLFISGYPSERAISAEHTDGRFSFLQKPFSAIELATRVRKMLDGE